MCIMGIIIHLVKLNLICNRNPNENILRKLMQKLERNPTVGSKVMAILTRYSSLADETSSSPSCDSIATPRKTASRKLSKNSSAIQWWDKTLWPFDLLLKSGRQDLLVTELWFHNNPNENNLRKVVQKFQRDPTIWSNVMAILKRYSSLADEISSSPSCVP
jgi:hypothetical protein